MSDALNAVVREVDPLLWHVARAQGLAHGPAADVVQTTWLVSSRHLDPALSAPELRAGLAATVRREAWRLLPGRRAEAGSDAGENALPAVAELPEPAHELDRALWRVLPGLSERCRGLLRVVALVDRSDHDVIAEAMGMPRGSVAPTLDRCLAEVRELLPADAARAADPDGPLGGPDAAILDAFARVWAVADPPPADLDARVSFALRLDDLDVEAARSRHDGPAGSGAGAAEQARTVTFDCDILSLMVSVLPGDDGVRVDGWLAPPAALRVELRTGAAGPDGRDVVHGADADQAGRFVLTEVPSGLGQLLVYGAGLRTVVTPAIVL
ncbi:sigma-70 family RNA polymerase sigma factor [Catellatospora sp. NPDC049609]|uniref:RNA polymerase sigma factor n=1 Tax=Catellatospora sp. NPDC049609 TaxID=3155505 RepID=UPI003419B6B9